MTKIKDLGRALVQAQRNGTAGLHPIYWLDEHGTVQRVPTFVLRSFPDDLLCYDEDGEIGTPRELIAKRITEYRDTLGKTQAIQP